MNPAIGIITVDAALAVRTWDAWVAGASGIPAAAARGRPLVEVVPDLAARGLFARFEQVLATGEVQMLAPAFHHYLIPCPLADPRPAVRSAIIAALGRMPHPDASAAIRGALDDAEPAVRHSAVTALGRLGARGVSCKFAEMARVDASRAVRRAASAALFRQGRISASARRSRCSG